MKKSEKILRKSISMPEILWEEISEFRFSNRMGSESEAVRQLLLRALSSEGKKK